MRSRSDPSARGERARVARRALGVLDPSAETGGEPPSRLAGFFERRGWRVDPGVRGVAAMGVVALLAVAVAGWWVLSARPRAAALSSSSASASSVSAPSASVVPTSPRSSSAGAASSSGAAPVVVDVVGRVLTPGLYRLPVGARVDDALRAAGGALPGTDLTGLNLARKVSDGEQIAVGVAGAPVTAADSGSLGGASGPVDLNTASLAQLDALPGVGPVLAQHILDWRTAHGKFDSIEQLREVSGIGEAKFADLRALVTV